MTRRQHPHHTSLVAASLKCCQSHCQAKPNQLLDLIFRRKMSGEVSLTPQGYHKRPHEEERRRFAANDSLNQFVQPSDLFPEVQGVASVREDNGSQTSSHKRARLYGEYRENDVSPMDSGDDEDGETTLCSNVAVRSASEDASTGSWLLRSSTSNYSITSTLTEISDTMETVDAPAMDGDLPAETGGPCFVLEGTPGVDVGDHVESITNRLDSWSLSRMKTMKISNILSVASLSERNGEALSESRKHRLQQTKRSKREVMRAFRKSNSTGTD